MSATTLPGLPQAWAALRGTGVGLIVGILALGGLFHTEVTTAIDTWWDSTAYNHCFLVVPIAAYLIWDRAAALRGLAARPLPLAAIAGLPLAIGWLVAERLGIMEGRQLIAVTFLEVLFLGVLGWRLWRAISGPLLYLYFLVPFGEFLTPKLQDITAVFVHRGLDFLQITAFVDGYVIEIPEGTFYVAQACAGLRFLIASIAFGVLYALLMYRSPMRRGIFLLISIIVPIIANGFRALGIVLLGHVLGSAEAAATDHVLYGWMFFSLVILLLLACGLPFREDQAPVATTTAAPDEPVPAGGQARSGGLAVAMSILIAALSPAAAALLDRAAGQAGLALAPLDPGAGCASQPGGPPVRARASLGGQAMDQRITCEDGTAYDLHVARFSPRSTAGPVMGERRRLSRPPEVEETKEDWLEPREPHVWRLLTGTELPYAMSIGLWIDGAPSLPGLRVRARMAWASVAGGQHAPVVATITPAVEWKRMPPDLRRKTELGLSAFLEARPGLVTQIQALTTGGGR